jgi:hypothetical protein
MSDTSKPFAFSQFVPGFDFLKNLAGGAAASPGAVPGLPSLSSWVAPTLSIEEVDKRIQELKTVQYWLEQNGHALKATIQALEVQQMTLSTLRGMNVRMEDLASVFTRPPTPRHLRFRAEPPAPEPEPEEGEEQEVDEPWPRPLRRPSPKSKPAKRPSTDLRMQRWRDRPLQWWGALTQRSADRQLGHAGRLPTKGAGHGQPCPMRSARQHAQRRPRRHASRPPPPPRRQHRRCRRHLPPVAA